MRRLMPFLACLMLVLTGWSGMAHAAESVGGGLSSAEFTVHVPGDGDEVPADQDTGYPHHHNSCHGHDVGHRSADGPAIARADNEPRSFTIAAHPLTAADGGVIPRPPQA